MKKISKDNRNSNDTKNVIWRRLVEALEGLGVWHQIGSFSSTFAAFRVIQADGPA